MDEPAEADSPQVEADALADRRAELLELRSRAIVAGTTADVVAVNAKIDRFNDEARAAGRPDLTIPH
jgi:hypothetical protein